MNIQNVNGNKRLEIKKRIIELQAAVKSNQETIQAKRDAYDARKVVARRNRMTAAEFLALHPNPPALTAENALLTAKKIQLGPYLTKANEPLAREILELEMLISRTLAAYNAEKINPSMPLTENEYTALYPEPNDSNFTAELNAISAARNEANLLGQFCKSGPFPNPGSYDVDFLTGTAVAFP